MKVKVLILELLLAAGVFTAQQAIAEESAVKQDGVSIYSELDALRSQNILLTEQLKNADLKSKVNTAKGIQAPTSLGFTSRSSQPSKYIDRAARVQLVAGVGDKLSANIQLSDGGTAIAHVGMYIPNLGLVKTIKIDEVIVQNGKETISVPFASEPTAHTSQYSSPYLPSPQSGAVVPPISLPMGSN